MSYRIALFSLLALLACKSPQPTSQKDIPVNPAAEGFNLAGSDSMAIAIADQAMEAMGGRKAWDETNVIGWSFFGRRDLLWDKQNNRVRIELPSADLVLICDLTTDTGKAYGSGEEITDTDRLASLMEDARAIWINDSYWLVMPFKLKDSGVTLKHLRTDSLEAGMADVLELTFSEVGITPDNKYEVWVDQETHLVCQWAYFRTYDDPKPSITTPWDGYQTYGNILLGGGRGVSVKDGKEVKREMGNISIMDSVSDSRFQFPDLLFRSDE